LQVITNSQFAKNTGDQNKQINYFVLNYNKNKNSVQIVRWNWSKTIEATGILTAAIWMAGTMFLYRLCRSVMYKVVQI
jgi:hypothetical protein